MPPHTHHGSVISIALFPGLLMDYFLRIKIIASGVVIFKSFDGSRPVEILKVRLEIEKMHGS